MSDDALLVGSYRQRAEAGDASYQYMLGTRYELGNGVQKDLVQADKWYILAAARGHSEASSHRESLEKSMAPEQIAEASKLASEWKPVRSDADLIKQNRPTAEAGDADAQYTLGSLYAKENIPQSDIVADMWFILSASRGNQQAARDSKLIEKRMTPEQIAEAKKLASEWKPVSAGATATPAASTAPTTGVSEPVTPSTAPPASAPSHPRIGPV